MKQLIAIVLTILSSGRILAQDGTMAPALPLSGGWEQMDQRLVFLMVRLVDVEANLDAVDNAIARTSGRAASAKSTATRAELGNNRMDQRAGGPVRWDQFYGRTAEKFFYHPTQNHTYHTETILGQRSPASDTQSQAGVPSRQGVPVHQRPPQFDYMYRANANAKERATAEIAKIANKIDALTTRRQQLELEQSKLWCEVAFRAVSRNDLDRKPLYRFMPAGSGQEALAAAASFVVVALSVVKAGESDQGNAFRQVKPLISKARIDLGEKWLHLGVKYQDYSSDEWKFSALARHLEDVSSNLSDSYAVSIDSARNSDNDRRDMYRGLLQKSLVQYAETVLALNEMASEIADTKGFEPDLKRPIVVQSIRTYSPAAVSISDATARNGGSYEAGTHDSTEWLAMFDGKSLDGWRAGGLPGAWRVENGTIVCSGESSHLYYIGSGSFKNFHFTCDAKCLAGSNSGIYFHTQFEDQGFPQLGLECQLDTERKKTGSLYGVVDVNNPSLRNGQWFNLEIIVTGNRVTIKTDGRIIVNYTQPRNQKPATGGFERLIGEGIFALQSNSPSFETHFRNIQVRRLGN